MVKMLDKENLNTKDILNNLNRWSLILFSGWFDHFSDPKSRKGTPPKIRWEYMNYVTIRF